MTSYPKTLGGIVAVVVMIGIKIILLQFGIEIEIPFTGSPGEHPFN